MCLVTRAAIVAERSADAETFFGPLAHATCFSFPVLGPSGAAVGGLLLKIGLPLVMRRACSVAKSQAAGEDL